MNNVKDAKMNDVPLACEQLSKAITELEEVLNNFHHRLSGITRQEPASAIEVGQENASTCELSTTIRDQVNRLRGMIERIREHNSMLEL